MRSLAGYIVHGVAKESDTTEQLNNKMLKEFFSLLGDFFDCSWVTAADPPAHSHAFPGAKSLFISQHVVTELPLPARRFLRYCLNSGEQGSYCGAAIKPWSHPESATLLH